MTAHFLVIRILKKSTSTKKVEVQVEIKRI